MAKKVVIFGPDNAGKTTLANQLKEEFGYDYSHSPGPVSAERMVEYIVDNLTSKQNVLFDRFPIIEEMTCGKVLRNHNNFNDLEDFNVFFYLSQIDLFIYCCPEMEKITNWGEREQMAGIKENIELLRKAYDDLATKLGEDGFPLIRYDWTKSEQLKEVKERMESI